MMAADTIERTIPKGRTASVRLSVSINLDGPVETAKTGAPSMLRCALLALRPRPRGSHINFALAPVARVYSLAVLGGDKKVRGNPARATPLPGQRRQHYG